MVQIIAGKEGKGKAKHLLGKANAAIKESKGPIVYLDKSSKHMYELNNKTRLVNVQGYNLTDSSGSLGFVYGIISQDHDLEIVFLDSFLKLACLGGEDISNTITKLENIGKIYHVTFVLSVSMDADELPKNAKKDVIISS